MLHETLPLLTKLHIDKSSELNLTVASRFRDIREIHINSLYDVTIEEAGTEDECRDIYVDFETKIRLLPFLSRFDKLERVFFGGKDENGKEIERFAPATDFSGKEMKVILTKDREIECCHS